MYKKSLLMSSLLWISQYAFGHSVKIESVFLDNTEKLSPPTKEFSAFIVFKANTSLTNWLLGFYMPFTLNKTASLNPNLTLQICSIDSFNRGLLEIKSRETLLQELDPKNCQKLDYAVNKEGDFDLSAGWTSVLGPVKNSKYTNLQQNKHYLIKIEHNAIGVTRNYSSFPQSFFLINTKSKVVENLTLTNKEIYSVLDYNQSDIDNENEEHIQSTWSNSIPLKAQHPSFNLIPTPVEIHTRQKATNDCLTSGQVALITKSNITVQWHNVIKSFKNTITDDLQQQGVRVIQNSLPKSKCRIIIQKFRNGAFAQYHPEGYRIDVNPKSIVVSAATDTGAFYALQTLRQLWLSRDGSIPQMSIKDYPRFKYRGLLVDVSRHFRTPDELKHLIDLMAFHKLNTLHMHFSDDEGFRVPLKNYNQEIIHTADKRGYGTQIGSNKMAALLIKQSNLDILSNPSYPETYSQATDYYTGTYTKKDIQKIIQYANSHKITVIPEIDLPGHAKALIKAVNILKDKDDKSVFSSIQGYSDDVIPICKYQESKEFTEFIDNMLTDIASMFSNQTTLYAMNEVSLGGDEVSGDAWTASPACNKNPIWKNKFTALEKSHFFFKLVSEQNSNIKFSGWQQFIQTDDPDGALGKEIVPSSHTGHVWVWNNAKDGIIQAKTLANKNYPTVLDFSDELYFDLTYNKDKTELGQYWATDYSDTNAALQSALSSSTVQSTLSGSDKKNIVGLEAGLWSENLVTYDDMMYMTFPKLTGLAEAAWSPSDVTTNQNSVNWQSLAYRLGCGSSGHLALLNHKFGVKYRGYSKLDSQGIQLEVPENSQLCSK